LSMTVFYLLRHGEADYDLAERLRLKGHSRDLVPLTERGVAQIEETTVRLRDLGIQLIISSPMTRALHSAAIVIRLLDVPLRVEFDLREWAPDLTFSYDSVSVVEAASAEYSRDGGEWPAGQSRAWEPRSMVRERVTRVLDQYTHFERVLVVCHSGVISALTERSVGDGNWPSVAE
jgi:broad specificity phosphatase PhoE